MIKGSNILWGQKLAKICSFVGGRIIVQQEKRNVYLSSLMMKIPDNVYVLG
jgi:hypothetical protein